MDAIGAFFGDPLRQAQLIRTAVVLIVTGLLWWLLVRGGNRTIERFARGDDVEAGERRQRAQTLWSASRRLAAVVVVVVVILTIMNIWEIPITPLVAVGSAIGVAVGFGAQSLVKDIIAGFLILAEDQFGIGDVVRIADVSGTVESMRLRITVLRDLDGNTHYIPNGIIAVASNFTQTYAQVVVDVGVAYKEDVDRALEVLGDELRRFAEDESWSAHVLEEPVLLGVQELGDSAVTLRGYLRVAPEQRWAVRREFLRRIKNRFDAESIEIPFPHRTVYFGNPPVPREA